MLKRVAVYQRKDGIDASGRKHRDASGPEASAKTQLPVRLSNYSASVLVASHANGLTPGPAFIVSRLADNWEAAGLEDATKVLPFSRSSSGDRNLGGPSNRD